MTNRFSRLVHPLLGTALLASGLAVGGCSAIVDGALHDVDGGAGGSTCAGLDDGTICEREGIVADLICRGGQCVNSRCGDGIPDDRSEECDDGNALDDDGCASDCTVVAGCTDDASCGDPGDCGVATCEGGACTFGVADDGTTCSTGTCRGGACVPDGCGDGALEGDLGEQCDDGNFDAGDGCSPFCKPECTSNADCVVDVCTSDAVECSTESNEQGVFGLCKATGSPLECDVCETCDPSTQGCVVDPSADQDGDGHLRPECRGDDCDDANAAVYPGQPETCSDGVDINCNGDDDEATSTTYYADCDFDGFAADGAQTLTDCAAPTAPPMACPGGGWTTKPPRSPVVDCNDDNSDVYPGQTAFFTSAVPVVGGFDYDCSGAAELEYPQSASPGSEACITTGTGCAGTNYLATSARCGARAELSICRLGLFVCVRDTTTAVVRCH